MGVISAVVGILRGSKLVVQLDAPPAAGSAAEAVGPLITTLRATVPIQIRSGSNKECLDAVIQREKLEVFSGILSEVFSEPAKPFDVRASFSGSLDGLVESGGGIAKDQCLYLRLFEDGYVAYAAFWPWGDKNQITMKVGVYSEPLHPDA